MNKILIVGIADFLKISKSWVFVDTTHKSKTNMKPIGVVSMSRNY
jgi:hypothetical protein